MGTDPEVLGGGAERSSGDRRRDHGVKEDVGLFFAREANLLLTLLQNTRESIPPPKKLPEEPHVPIQGSSPIVGYDMETP